MRIDLHTHSTASDGTTPPADLVRAACAAGLDVLGITDHDTDAGWAEAARAAEEVGLTLVRGMEVSTRHRGEGVHLLAYLPDPTYPPLVETLGKVLGGRGQRLPLMVAALAEHGVHLTEEEVRAANPGTDVVGRPHVADAMVAKGYVASRDEAFARWLGPGRPAYVDRWAAPLVETIRLVTEAGGVTVVAHPWARGRAGALPSEELAVLRDAGLTGVEVDHQDHDEEARAGLRGLAGDLDLVVTGSSDHHGLGKVDHDLGCNTTAPEQYERLLDAAARAAAASDRQPPAVLVG